ncbi:MAG: hypothetical protein ACTSP5_13265 [Candidatus Heimdallarchaeota archaeon]
MSHYEIIREEKKIKLKHKKLTMFVIFLGLLLLPVFSVSAEEATETVDFIIYLTNPDVQIIVDEIITSAEDIGLNVNPIYILDWNYFTYLLLFTTDWDLAYGGFLNNNNPDTLFQIAYGNMGLNFYYLKHNDAKYAKFSLQLYQWLLLAQEGPSVVNDDYINDMVDKFHDAEERLWEKQLIITLCEFMGGGPLRNNVLMPNSLSGHVFADEDLRLTFSRAIDRTVAVDYHLAMGHTSVNVLYHLYILCQYQQQSNKQPQSEKHSKQYHIKTLIGL